MLELDRCSVQPYIESLATCGSSCVLAVQAGPIIRLLYLSYGGVMYLPRRTS